MVNVYSDFVVSVQTDVETNEIGGVVVACDGKIILHCDDLIDASCAIEKYIKPKY